MERLDVSRTEKRRVQADTIELVGQSTGKPVAKSERKLVENSDESESRVALIGILVEDRIQSDQLNAILHQFSRYIVGRMGVPYNVKGIGIISVIVDAPAQTISAISGKLGMLKGVQVKTMFSKQ